MNTPLHQITKTELVTYKTKGHIKAFGMKVVNRVADGLMALPLRDISMFTDDQIREMLRKTSIAMKDNGELS